MCCAKVFSGYNWGGDELLADLANACTAQKMFPAWHASKLDKGFYAQAASAIQSHDNEIQKKVGQLVVSLATTNPKEMNGLASQIKGLASGVSQISLRTAIVALIDVICLTRQTTDAAPSVFKQTLTASLMSATASVQSFDWATPLRAMGVPDDFASAALIAAAVAMSSDKAETPQVLTDLCKHITSLSTLVDGTPDPLLSETAFLKYMSKHGAKIADRMKKVINIFME